MTHQGCRLETDYLDDRALRLSMDALARETFGGLSFEGWYQSGYMRGSAIPYSLFEGDRCVSSLFVNPFTLDFCGEGLKTAQLGTVMTAGDARGRGLSRFLMERALADWSPKTDAIYLYGNDTVVDFYPRFGFREWTESDISLTLPGGAGFAERLDLSKEGDLAFLKAKIAQGNPYAKITVENRMGVMMFFLTSWYRDCAYRLGDSLLVWIEEDGETTVADALGDGKEPLGALISRALPDQKAVKLGFLPKENIPFAHEPSREEDNHCYVMGEKSALFFAPPVRLPLLCRT